MIDVTEDCLSRFSEKRFAAGKDLHIDHPYHVHSVRRVGGKYVAELDDVRVYLPKLFDEMVIAEKMDNRFIMLRGAKKLQNGKKTPCYILFTGDPVNGPCKIQHA